MPRRTSRKIAKATISKLITVFIKTPQLIVAAGAALAAASESKCPYERLLAILACFRAK